MSRTLIVNIGQIGGITDPDTLFLRGKDIETFQTLDNAWLLTEDGLISDFGSMHSLNTDKLDNSAIFDAEGGTLLPSFCDSHTHIVFAGSREGEFADRIKGLSYEEIAANGGGILNSADLLARTSEEQLFESAAERLRDMIAAGTGCVEIKSGYGLTTESELKMLRVIKRLADTFPVEVKATFLGAHAVGREYAGRQQEYVDMVCDEMIPKAKGLAEFVDVFCDRGFFTPEQTSQILHAAAPCGMRPKIHANELAVSGGVQVGVAEGALSVDHLERIGDEELDLLAASDTVATMLPGASFFLGMPYGPAAKAIERGAILALASDFNPGSSPSGNMRFVTTLACVKMRLTPEAAFNAATINGAYAMRCSDRFGSIARGKVANFYITRQIPSLSFIPYAYTTPVMGSVWLRGNKI